MLFDPIPTQKFFCDLCSKLESPHLPPTWAEYKVDTWNNSLSKPEKYQHPFKRHLCGDCQRMVINTPRTRQEFPLRPTT